MPTNHAAFAVYGHERYGFLGRGVVQPDAMLSCLAKGYANQGGTEHSTIAGHDVLLTKKADAFGFLVSDDGVFVAATPSIIERMLATPFEPITNDRTLGPLIARARAGGEVWAAARFPHDAPYITDVLDVLGVKLAGHVVALVGSIHFTPPFHISIDLELEQAGDATLLSGALERRKHELVALDPNLASVVDSISLATTGAHVQLAGHFAKIDWLQTLQALLAAVARFKS